MRAVGSFHSRLSGSARDRPEGPRAPGFDALRDRGADRGDDRRRRRPHDPLAVDLLHDYELFGAEPAPACTAKTAPRPLHQPRVGFLHRALDVLGVVVAAADDDEILQSARDEQFAIASGTPSPRYEGTVRPGVGDARSECLLRLGRLAPDSPRATFAPPTQISPISSAGTVCRSPGPR